MEHSKVVPSVKCCSVCGKPLQAFEEYVIADSNTYFCYEHYIKMCDKKCEEASGIKFDEAKVPLDLLPFDALEEVAKVLNFGANRYGRHNWEKGMEWSRLLAAALRHLFAWGMRKGPDEETGLSHLAHAACCVLFLLSYELRSIGKDNRNE